MHTSGRMFGLTLLAALSMATGCIFGVDSSVSEDPDLDTSADASELGDTNRDGSLDCVERPEASACQCNYDQKQAGVCGSAVLGSDGECAKPRTYQSDETGQCDERDNDCDGVVDEGCGCNLTGTGEGVCSRGTIGGQDGECQPPESYEDPEESCDGKDNDCDGETDEDSDVFEGCDCSEGDVEPCYTGRKGTEGTGICESGTRTCGGDGGWSDCEGEQTPKQESLGDPKCDRKDNDCDGVVDEGCSCSFEGGTGVCSKARKGPNGACRAPREYESNGENSCGDDKDNDCDGKTDCEDQDCKSLYVFCRN